MAGKTCWKCCCDRFRDDFDRADSSTVGNDWDEPSGTSAIASNVLKLTGDAIVEREFHIAEATVDTHRAVVRVRSSDAGSKARLWLIGRDSGPPETNVAIIAEIEFHDTPGSATLRLWFHYDNGVDAAEEFLLKETQSFTAVSDTWYTLEVGHFSYAGDPWGVFWDDAFVFAFESTGIEENTIALESLDTSGNVIEWDDLRIYKHVHPGAGHTPGCPQRFDCGYPDVQWLAGTQLEVEIAGLADLDCEDCGDANALFTLDHSGYNPEDSPVCESDSSWLDGIIGECGCWQYTGAGLPCGWEALFVYVVSGRTNEGTVFDPPIVAVPDMAVGVAVQKTGSGIFEFMCWRVMRNNSGITAADPTQWLDMENVTTLIDCDGAAATCRVRLKP